MAGDFEDHCWHDVIDAGTIEIYQAYRRKTFVGDNPAVLAIDLYNKAYGGGTGRCARWIANIPAPAANMPGTRCRRPKSCSPRRVAPACRSSTPRATSIPAACIRRIATSRERDDIYDIKAEVAPQPGEIVIYKERASGFFGTPLIAHLQQLRVNSLIICGESTSGCVRASTVDAFSYGFHNVVVEECTYDRSMFSHKVNLFDLHHKYADVMHVEEVLAHLEGLAAERKVA